jgi:hypothetical protein
MRHSTYSFLDLAGAISHALFPLGVFQFTGEGVGEVTVAMDTERTAHDVAADGSIMVSKIAGNGGKITINCQQTSVVHKYLLSLYNYCVAAPANEWAMMAIVLRNVNDGTSHTASGVSFGKMPDKAYKSQGERVQWVMWAADITTMNG